MKNNTSVLIACLLSLLILLAACSSATPAAATTSPGSASTLNGAALVQDRCTACHPLSRVENARFSAAEWKIVVDAMIARGAQLTPDEETAVVSWLAANYGN